MDKCFDCVHYHKCFQNQRSVVVSKDSIIAFKSEMHSICSVFKDNVKNKKPLVSVKTVKCMADTF
ncbi:hypothetical protein E2C01_010844 [Portunus trituberculatus]|uniref:Uncharacterized protein n=1 Tax=Portunus trituberculatus TaxID=210409 RepID=A0A5B7D9T9_PORTR|nr:hypothetical protein [Portunus trituberculatus]